MLTDAKLRSQVDSLWDKLWSGGLTNPLDAIEQLSYLLFLKRLDDQENQRERQALRRGAAFTPALSEEMRWRHWSHFAAERMLKHVREVIFPAFRTLGAEDSSFQRYMANAEFKINKPALLAEAVKTIEQMEISVQNQDVQGDLYEYLLSHLGSTAGRNGQFRTPRHIIRLMVQMIDPKPGERIGDLAAGTCGFLVNAWQHILEQNTSPEILEYDAAGQPHNAVGDRLTPEQRDFLQNGAFRGYDNDSGMAMLRIGSMNLMLHGLHNPRFYYTDTLSKGYDESAAYDVILMNPPFKGAVDKDDVHPELPGNTTKSELLFLHLILRALEMGGRAAVIVPDGVLFGSSRAHSEIRRKLIQENRLDGVLSMPGGVFKPYAGVSTAVLFFTKGARTGDEIWFYDMAHDGFSLDDKRQPTAENDIPDILACWRNRREPDFWAARQEKLAGLEAEAAPVQAQRLELHGEINRLTFESVIAPPEDTAIQAELEAAQARLAALESRLAPLRAQMEQLGRCFWVQRAEIVAAGYDLTASRYRQATQDETFYEQPGVTLERLLRLDELMSHEIKELGALLA